MRKLVHSLKLWIWSSQDIGSPARRAAQSCSGLGKWVGPLVETQAGLCWGFLRTPERRERGQNGPWAAQGIERPGAILFLRVCVAMGRVNWMKRRDWHECSLLDL